MKGRCPPRRTARVFGAWLRFLGGALAGTAVVVAPLLAQLPTGEVSGTLRDGASREPIALATVTVEGTALQATSDPSGRFRLPDVPPGPQVLRVVRIGYAPVRHPFTMMPGGRMVFDLALAGSALNLPGLVVTADAGGRAAGELGTASVIEREAIRNQSAASLAGILELVPGTVLTSPGLEGVQQFALRSVPVSTGGSGIGPNAPNPSAEALAAFGTQIVLDGVPISNNANLQSLGGRGELALSSAAGGGIDLRRIPAATLERVEVIRGIPSVRFGDLTQGVVLVETRAGAVAPEVTGRLDSRTFALTLAAGNRVATGHTLTGVMDIARTRIAPGLTDDIGSRFAAQLSHRYDGRRVRLDTRADGFQLLDDRPESAVIPGVASRSRDAGFRLAERARWALGVAGRLELTAAFEGVRQRSFTMAPRLRGAMPFTDRLTDGRQVGKYIGGLYSSRVDLEGDPRHFYSRLEYGTRGTAAGFSHELRLGGELRREWNSGAGYQFDIEFPPQVEFNGVQGYDRPRRFDDLPPIVTTAAYLDDRFTRPVGGAYLTVQAGLRLDLLHQGSSWASGIRDAVAQPRLMVELAPAARLRLRAGAGRLAKTPALASLAPAPQYHDLVNVNYFANEPAERLAVVTTRILDRANPELGLVVADKLNAGFELNAGDDGLIAVDAFLERTRGAIGVLTVPTSLLRERFALDSATIGTGRPPAIVEPAVASDTVPVLIDRPSNNLQVAARGVELTVLLPELRPLRLRVAMLGSWVRDQVNDDGVQFSTAFTDLQLSDHLRRAPYWQGASRVGERMLLTTRLIHHQPRVGLVITATVQQTLRELRQDLGATDTLGFAGYITREGSLVPVPASERGAPGFADLRKSRSGLLTEPQKGPSDWLMNVQVSKTLPLGARVSFYAFNAFDRLGSYGDKTTTPRLYPRTRFGLELNVPLGLGWGTP